MLQPNAVVGGGGGDAAHAAAGRAEKEHPGVNFAHRKIFDRDIGAGNAVKQRRVGCFVERGIARVANVVHRSAVYGVGGVDIVFKIGKRAADQGEIGAAAEKSVVAEGEAC